MVDMGTAVIVSSFVTMLGLIVFSQINLGNWFKKENFKVQKSNIQAQNRLTLKKLEREMGLKPDSSKPALPHSVNSGPLATLSLLAPVLRNLDGDQIADLIDKFVPGDEERSDNILDKIPQPLIDAFLKGLNKEGSDDQATEPTPGFKPQV